MRYKDFGKTLAAIRKQRKLNQLQLAELLNEKGLDVRANTLSKWEKNVNSPNVLQFFTLCDALGIEDINEAFGVAVENSLYARLNPEGQKKALEYMDLLIRSGLYAREEPVSRRHVRILRFYDLPVSAGTGQLLDSDQYSEIEVGDEVSPEAEFGVRVSGDSMEPLYRDRQVIWIHRQETLEEGEIGIFYLDGESYVKKYHCSADGPELHSLNKEYAPIPVRQGMSFRIFGKVVG
mgnify:CR=1 FL=1